MEYLVIVPALNAEDTLPELITRLKAHISLKSLLIIDDGSTDNTSKVATDRGAKVIRHVKNQGKGAALRSGFDYARELKNVDAVITMDADLQHAPEDLIHLIAIREKMRPNIVLGMRTIYGTKMPIDRRFSNTLTSFMVSIRTGVKIKDSQCGFRLIGREVLDGINLVSNGYEAETEFLIKAAKQGFTFASVPIRTVYGSEKSHMTRWHTTKQFVRILFREY